MTDTILTGPYSPLYSPWKGAEFSARYAPIVKHTLVSPDRCYILERLLRHTEKVPGDVFECGVYKGGTARLLADTMRWVCSTKTLHLFDTFTGMPDTDAKLDKHKKGDFADTSLAAVESYIGARSFVKYHSGFIPDTFSEVPDDIQISFAHVDVDIYRSVMDCLEFIWPRLSAGGVVIFDDYGFPTCPGAKDAVDAFFEHTEALPVCLPTGQAFAYKV